MGAYLLAGTRRARAAEDRLREVGAAHQAQVAGLRQALAEAGRLADGRLQAVAAAAYERGRADAEPAVAKELIYWRQAAPALFEWRERIDRLADQVLDHLGRHEGPFWESELHRRYVAAAHRRQQTIDYCLDVALEPLRAVWAVRGSQRRSPEVSTMANEVAAESLESGKPEAEEAPAVAESARPAIKITDLGAALSACEASEPEGCRSRITK